MKDTKTKEEKLIEFLISIYGNSNFAIVNKSTGEIQDLPFGSGTVLPKVPKFDKQNRVLTKFLGKETFVKLYKRSINELNKALSYRNFTWFVSLSEYLGMNDCILYDEDYNYLNIKQLSNLLEVDYDNLRSAFRDYIKLGLVKKIKVTSNKDIYKKVQAIAVNPYLYMNGEYIVEDIRKEFADTKWAKMYTDEKSI